jgi:hypothetical protein
MYNQHPFQSCNTLAEVFLVQEALFNLQRHTCLDHNAVQEAVESSLAKALINRKFILAQQTQKKPTLKEKDDYEEKLNTYFSEKFTEYIKNYKPIVTGYFWSSYCRNIKGLTIVQPAGIPEFDRAAPYTVESAYQTALYNIALYNQSMLVNHLYRLILPTYKGQADKCYEGLTYNLLNALALATVMQDKDKIKYITDLSIKGNFMDTEHSQVSKMHMFSRFNEHPRSYLCSDHDNFGNDLQSKYEAFLQS